LDFRSWLDCDSGRADGGSVSELLPDLHELQMCGLHLPHVLDMKVSNEPYGGRLRIWWQSRARTFHGND